MEKMKMLEYPSRLHQSPQEVSQEQKVVIIII